jgi:hypothetical protein
MEIAIIASLIIPAIIVHKIIVQPILWFVVH